MKKNLYLILIFIIWANIHQINAQIASDTLGCIPLLVNFKSPDTTLTQPRWDFIDGASSDRLHPSHVFSKVGTYLVTLKNADTLVATVKIVILPELTIQIAVDTNQGCAPITIQFNDLTSYPAGIIPQQYLWDFGDGIGSTIANPYNTYINIGQFDVTFTVKTNIAQCDVTQSFPDLINIGDKQDIRFTIDNIAPLCTLPTTVYYTNTGITDPSYQFLWDFVNGITSIKPQPDPVIYLDEGNYKVVLEVDNKKGCKSSIFLVNELIFFPKFAIKIVDSFCLNQSLPIENNTIADVFSWDFGINANTQMSNLKNPENIKFLKPGDQTIKLTATSKFGCNKDTTFIVKTSKMDASFQMDPPFGCSLPLEVNFRANVPSYPQYEWNTISGTSQTIKTIDDIKRDTFYYNKLDSIPMILKVTSEGGCTASDTTHFYYQLPNSQFSLNNFEGEVPYLLTVQDKSESLFPIAKWIFNWGDGTSNEYNQNNIHTAAHLYTEIGKYYVNLTIITDAGCKDEYYGAWITVHEKPTIDIMDPPTCNGGGSSDGGFGILCYRDTFRLSISNAPRQFDAFHIRVANTVSHCESLKSIETTALDDPGTHKFGATLENGGVFYEIESNRIINIHGAKSKINYQTNCIDKNSVFFENNSINAISHYWIIDDQTINADTFTYQFKQGGDHKVMLIAENDTDGCKPDTSSVTISIRDVKAKISTKANWCAGVPTLLSSTLSEDEIVGCKMGYFWSFPKYLDMEHIITDNDSIEVSLPGGVHKLSLEVRDVNGCRDTSYLDVSVHSLHADFSTDKPAICDSIVVKFSDISTHDNPIISYVWNFAPDKNQPIISHLFDSLAFDSVAISLSIQDIFGCVSSVSKSFDIYQPTSYITFDSIVCVSNLQEIRASDYNHYGSSLSYQWRINDVVVPGQEILRLPTLNPGIHHIKLMIIEKSSHCKNDYEFKINVLDDPKAVIGGLEDSLFCYPKSFILLADQSIKDPKDELTYWWDFGNNKSSSKRNPVVTYGKGNYNISLTAISKYGCRDTIVRSISLVGPEGKIIADKDLVCKGEKITFQVIDAIDVSSFYWDFGQGETDNEISPATYQYNFVPESGTTFASLVLESSETGCETVLTMPISIHQVNAAFASDTTCSDSIHLINYSKGADTQLWKHGNTALSQDFSPWINLGKPGTYPIQLSIHNITNGCRDTIENLITFLPRPEVNVPPIIDLCADETYSFNINPDDKYEINPPGFANIQQNTLSISAQNSERIQISANGLNGCNTTVYVDIIHNEYNNKDFVKDYVLCDDYSAIDLKQSLQPGDSIVWSLDDIKLPSGYLSCDTCHEPQILQIIIGELKASIYNQKECLQRSYYYHIENAKIETPNFFSPNGDQVNEYFGPVIKNTVSQSMAIEELKIYNRWGKEVYQSNQIWDGKINGQLAPAEVYYYTLTYKIGDGCLHTTKGNVTLMR